mmetsp:Transcript_60070/g.196131  ORF Transcript_60070/g.196131 Transcript_60070/m.196131 type:complete len:145 (+) Transcript_60070:2647-3081(+)
MLLIPEVCCPRGLLGKAPHGEWRAPVLAPPPGLALRRAAPAAKAAIDSIGEEAAFGPCRYANWAGWATTVTVVGCACTAGSELVPAPSLTGNELVEYVWPKDALDAEPDAWAMIVGDTLVVVGPVAAYEEAVAAVAAAANAGCG